MTVKTHKPNSVVWNIALVLFIYVLIGFLLVRFPLPDVAIFVSAVILLLGTTVF
jgi:hypothetical protein